MPLFNALSFVLSEQLAANEGITDPARRTFYGLLGGILGSTPVGLGVTLALANQEAEQNPPPIPATPLTITTASTLPDAVDGQKYSQTLRATGGTAPYMWDIVAGTLPQKGKNISLASTGVLGGVPDAAGGD